MAVDNISDAEMPLMGKRLYHIPLDCDAEHPDNWILAGNPDRVKRHDEEKAVFEKLLDNYEFIGENREFRLAYGEYNGKKVAVLSTGIGMGPTDIAMNELRMLRQYDPNKGKWLEDYEPLKIIRVGTSGTPSKRVSIPSIAISDYSIGFDNVGSKYEYEFESGDDLHQLFDKAKQEIKGKDSKKNVVEMVNYVSKGSKKLADKLYFLGLGNEFGIPVYSGITTSSASFYAGQERDISGLKITTGGLVDRLNKFSFNGLRVVNWEMETSLIFRLSQIFGYEAGSVCAVLGNRKTKDAVKGDEYARSVDAAALTGLEALTI
jgi:uridine phosphorylase